MAWSCAAASRARVRAVFPCPSGGCAACVGWGGLGFLPFWGLASWQKVPWSWAFGGEKPGRMMEPWPMGWRRRGGPTADLVAGRRMRLFAVEPWRSDVDLGVDGVRGAWASSAGFVHKLLL